jgi:hypothetical protein
MKSFAGRIASVLAICIAGCSAKPLQPDMAGSGGIGTIGVDGGITGGGGASAGGAAAAGGAIGSGGAIGAGGVTGTGGATDSGAAGAPFTGRRSFVVTSTLSPAASTPGTDGGLTGALLSHSFTLIVDGDRSVAIAGWTGDATAFAIQPFAGGFRADGSLHFTIYGTACPGYLTYSDFEFSFDPAGQLLGSGTGQLTAYVGDVGSTVDVTMSLAGVADMVPPMFSLSSDDPSDPFASFTVLSSEPLPDQTPPTLRSASGDVVPLFVSERWVGTTPGPIYYLTQYGKPLVLLRYDEPYIVDFGLGIGDFAGNLSGSTSQLTFTTRAAPPLVAADGFESVTDAALGGAQVLSSTAGDPTITGTRSLYVPPTSVPVTQASTQLALRLAIAPGDTVLRFSYRMVNASTTTNAYFEVGTVGGTIVTSVPPLGGTSTTTATVGGTQVTLGPVATATIALPGDTGAEIAFQRVTSATHCGLPSPPTPGIIIDDLRAE